MSNKEPFPSKIRKHWQTYLAAIVILAAFICSLWINFGIRAPIEARDKTVGLVVDYDELKRLADGSQDITFNDMLRKAKLAGATALGVRERILSDYEIAGDVLVFSGGQLKFQLENKYGDTIGDVLQGLTVEANKTYILTKDQVIYDQIFSLLDAKKRYPVAFTLEGYMGIATQLHSSERASLGLGFPLAQLKEAAAMGYQIIPRLRSWLPVTSENLQVEFNWVAQIPNLAGVGFNDTAVPGGGTDPEIQDLLADQIAKLGKPLVSFEFYDQTGLPGLVTRLNNNWLRAHTIADNEVRNYTTFQAVMDRYNLAVTERNIRYIYMRLNGLENPAASLLGNIDLITGVRDGLETSGFTIGAPQPLPEFTIGRLPHFLLGAGVIAAGGWLIALALSPYFKKKWYLPYAILVAFGCVVWAGALIIAPTLSRKLLSLASAIVFPSLGILLILLRFPRDSTDRLRGKQLLSSVGELFVITIFSFVGAMITSALLVEPSFMLKLNSFVGVKAADILPIIIVPCVLLLRGKDWFGLISGTVKSHIRIWQLIVAAVVLAGLVIYILRTGNDNPAIVTGLELKFRQLLDHLLGVRPRTKELLIGHPMMLILLYFGYQYRMIPVLMIGVIGQLSLVNTFTHLHTPVMISVIRSAHGLWIGTIVGIVAILIIEWIIRRMRVILSRRAAAG